LVLPGYLAVSPDKRDGNTKKIKEGMVMTCRRCGGLMIWERFGQHRESFWGRKCIMCGEIIDDVILHNRLHFRHAQRVIGKQFAQSLSGDEYAIGCK
jgi:ssDNA-binding Zn-finger/Zn-ribbon topoisomerase 1